MPKQEIDGSELFDISLSIVGVILNEGDQTLKELADRFDVSEKVIKKAVHAITDSEDLKECSLSDGPDGIHAFRLIKAEPSSLATGDGHDGDLSGLQEHFSGASCSLPLVQIRRRLWLADDLRGRSGEVHAVSGGGVGQGLLRARHFAEQ